MSGSANTGAAVVALLHLAVAALGPAAAGLRAAEGGHAEDERPCHETTSRPRWRRVTK